jgi:hypothetical protein
LPFFSSRNVVFHGALFFGALETEQKSRCSHQEQRPSPGDFVRESLHSRASAENPVLNQATVALLLGWQTTAFAAAIPNAWLSKIVPVPNGKLILQKDWFVSRALLCRIE